jgi:hypothetical protein
MACSLMSESAPRAQLASAEKKTTLAGDVIMQQSNLSQKLGPVTTNLAI